MKYNIFTTGSCRGDRFRDYGVVTLEELTELANCSEDEFEDKFREFMYEQDENEHYMRDGLEKLFYNNDASPEAVKKLITALATGKTVITFWEEGTTGIREVADETANKAFEREVKLLDYGWVAGDCDIDEDTQIDFDTLFTE